MLQAPNPLSKQLPPLNVVFLRSAEYFMGKSRAKRIQLAAERIAHGEFTRGRRVAAVEVDAQVQDVTGVTAQIVVRIDDLFTSVNLDYRIRHSTKDGLTRLQVLDAVVHDLEELRIRPISMDAVRPR